MNLLCISNPESLQPLRTIDLHTQPPRSPKARAPMNRVCSSPPLQRPNREQAISIAVPFLASTRIETPNNQTGRLTRPAWAEILCWSLVSQQSQSLLVSRYWLRRLLEPAQPLISSTIRRPLGPPITSSPPGIHHPTERNLP